jgi:cysteine-rich repeat protein
MSFHFARSAAALAAAVFFSIAAAPASHAGEISCGNFSCEIGESCDSCPMDCGPCCGNGEPDAGEACDDGGTFATDGCNENCLIEEGYPCDGTPFPVQGDSGCESGICDEGEDTPTCEAALTCDNSVCEPPGEDCITCEQDCGACPTTTVTTTSTSTTEEPPTTSTTIDTPTTSTTVEQPSTTTTMVPDSTTTTIPESSTTTEEPTTTTSTTSTTSSTMQPIVGACCFSNLCQEVEADYCTGELQGTYNGDESSCEEPGICSTCGNGCIEFSEDCDDADTEDGDGCDSDCQEEECWICSTAQLTGDTGPVAVCPGGGPSFCEDDVECTICGDGVTEGDEQCDPGQAANPCCDECQFASTQTSCPDETFCDGIEMCDGSGNCNSTGTPPSCSHLTDECNLGTCDPKLDACVVDVEEFDGAPCSGVGDCTTGAGVCEEGECVGGATTLSPSCRWIIVGGTPADDVRVRTGPGSTVDADMCGDTARIGGITSDDIVAIAATGEGIRFYGPPEVAGDIVTGGATVRASLYLYIPGTTVKSVDTGMTVAKVPSGVVDTTGSHELVDVCADDQAILAAARTTLDNMASDRSEGLKVTVGSSFPIDVTGEGIVVIDMAQLKVSHGANLTLKGNADDVVMLRVNEGRMKFGYGASLTLDGLVPENVLIYADGSRCRVSPGVVGAGTIFCPDANRFIIGSGVDWSGTFLGAAREVRVRKNAALTHVPFTGF